MGLCLIIIIFVFMMIYSIEFNKLVIYFIELNQLIRIKILCGGLYQLNQMKMILRVKQQICTSTRSKIRGVEISNIKSIIFFRERGKKQLTMGEIYLMTSC